MRSRPGFAKCSRPPDVRNDSDPGSGAYHPVVTDPLPSPAGTIAAPRQRQGTLVLADISGFTGFLQGVADAHMDLIVEADEPPAAYSMMSHLLDTIVGAMAPTFEIAKLEGDAVFAVAEEGSVDGPGLLAAIHDWYRTFRAAYAAAWAQRTCPCGACVRMGQLDLKFVVHHGRFVTQSIAGRSELLGPSVNAVHRLLKNHARELVGVPAYVLVTDDASTALAMPLDGFVPGVESYPDVPDIAVHVLALG